MAHAILEHIAAQRGLSELSVRSAGTMGFEGSAALENARRVCEEHGLSLRGFRSSALTPLLIAEADRVLVMEDSHFRKVQAMVDGRLGNGKLNMLSAFHPDRNLPREIPDPVGLRIEHFRVCFGVLEACLRGFLDSVVSHQ